MSLVVVRCDTGTLVLMAACLKLRRVGSAEAERFRPLARCRDGPLAACGVWSVAAPALGNSSLRKRRESGNLFWY
jgi:hypothetical protein